MGRLRPGGQSFGHFLLQERRLRALQSKWLSRLEAQSRARDPSHPRPGPLFSLVLELRLSPGDGVSVPHVLYRIRQWLLSPTCTSS